MNYLILNMITKHNLTDTLTKFKWIKNRLKMGEKIRLKNSKKGIFFFDFLSLALGRKLL